MMIEAKACDVIYRVVGRVTVYMVKLNAVLLADTTGMPICDQYLGLDSLRYCDALFRHTATLKAQLARLN